ncbi:hypothetical protein MG293_013840 [Ovis ammon polii]|uniref:Uncharacterized protein n=1 Tax=Ovis ammon polii TaxID=230172 RepID=A0AAD4TXK7_OVIAM|nr:hypothetical protein MG293_013840 [Ovis ammon polii]
MAATPTSEKLAEGHVALPKLVQDSNKSSNLESGSEPGKLHFEHTPRGSSAYPCLKPTDEQLGNESEDFVIDEEKPVNSLDSELRSLCLNDPLEDLRAERKSTAKRFLHELKFPGGSFGDMRLSLSLFCFVPVSGKRIQIRSEER